MSYSVLHCHSTYSLLDGLSKPFQIADRCKEIGVKACALTDHGNIAGAVKFYSEMKKSAIKPILGCELYICKDDPSIKTKENKDLGHFIVLAKNYNGWKKLVRLVSESNKSEYFYHKPRLDLKTLSKFIDGNIIAIVGHLGSTLSDCIVNNYDSIRDDWKISASKHIQDIKAIFGSENVFLEAQLMDKDNLPIQIQLTNCIREIGKITQTKVVCTPDAHYCRKQDAADQRVLLCNNLKITFPEISRKISNNEDVPLGCFFLSDNYHILSFEEMQSLHTEEEISNTNYVASIIEEYDILSKPNLPTYDCPVGFNPDEYLRELCRKGWREKIADKIPQNDQQVYVDRIKHELEVLQGAGLSSYFLIVQDIVNFVKQKKWLAGPGRGCFTPDTNIIMADGTRKNIGSIQIRDRILDYRGEPQEVTNTMQFDVEEDLLELEFGDKIIKCTKDHKFFTNNRGWVQAQDLTEEDDVKEIQPRPGLLV